MNEKNTPGNKATEKLFHSIADQLLKVKLIQTSNFWVFLTNSFKESLHKTQHLSFCIFVFIHTADICSTE